MRKAPARSLVRAPSVAIRAEQAAICWSMLTFFPTKHEVRTASGGAGDRASAGTAASTVARDTARVAARPILVHFKFVIIVFASSGVADLQSVSLCNFGLRIGSFSAAPP